jgi:hypothetical protein
MPRKPVPACQKKMSCKYGYECCRKFKCCCKPDAENGGGGPGHTVRYPSGGGGVSRKKIYKPQFPVNSNNCCVTCNKNVKDLDIIAACGCGVHRRHQLHYCGLIECCPMALLYKDIKKCGLINDLEDSQGKIYWLNGEKKLGVFLKRILLDDNRCCALNKPYYELVFSENIKIVEDHLFPPEK